MREYHIITAAASRHRQAWRRPFTLVELMVVIIIASIILAFAVPAFQKLAVGGGVDAAARMVSSQLSLARAEAISRRQYIAVIMPGADFDKASDDENLYRYQSFRSAVVEPPSTGSTYTFDHWVEGTEWTFLPTGTVIAEADGDTEELDMTVDPPQPKGDAWSIGDGSLQTVKDGTSPAKMVDVVGVANTSVRAVIFKPNGRCVQKTYVTILEGVAPEGSIQRENKFNIRVMEVNAFTGQIRYLF